jgi:hypothetical protein
LGSPLREICTAGFAWGDRYKVLKPRSVSTSHKNSYQIGIKISDEDFEAINIECDKFHGEWNYIIKPKIS